MIIDRDRWYELQRSFEMFDKTQPYLAFERDGVEFVRAPGAREPFLVPYLPFVGPRYEEHELLIYSMAQQVTGGDVEAWWPTCMGTGPAAVRRLYAGAEGDAFGPGPLSAFPVHRNKVPIQPISDGPLLAIAGLIIQLTAGTKIQGLDEVLSGISCTNYYKFSLVKRSETGRLKNQDPSGLGPLRLAQYARLMADDFCLPEMEVLRPRIVVAVTKAGPRILESIRSADHPFFLLRINDPSWILQGHRGHASPGGSWWNQVERERIPTGVAELIDCYANQFTGDYANKQAPMQIYLKRYWLKFAEVLKNEL